MKDIKDGRYLDDGAEYWFKNGQLHRVDGPAISYENGTQFWYRNGLKHRTGGPAVIRANGIVEYWKHGSQIEASGIVFKKQ